MEVASRGALETLQEDLPEFCDSDDLPVSAAHTEIINMGSNEEMLAAHLLVPQRFLETVTNCLEPLIMHEGDMVRCQLREPVLPSCRGTLLRLYTYSGSSSYPCGGDIYMTLSPSIRSVCTNA